MNFFTNLLICLLYFFMQNIALASNPHEDTPLLNDYIIPLDDSNMSMDISEDLMKYIRNQADLRFDEIFDKNISYISIDFFENLKQYHNAHGSIFLSDNQKIFIEECISHAIDLCLDGDLEVSQVNFKKYTKKKIGSKKKFRFVKNWSLKRVKEKFFELDDEILKKACEQGGL